MIGKLLAGAVKLYLRSQVEGVEKLQVKILGTNKQIFRGCIPQVLLSCDRAVYRGLHLSRVKLEGKDIAVNLSEVVKNKPLKLLEPIFVEIELMLDAADLQASLAADLLQSGLSDLWQIILKEENQAEEERSPITWQQVGLENGSLQLAGTYEADGNKRKNLTLSGRLNMTAAHTLCLSSLNIISNITSDVLENNLDRQVEIDLGRDVAIEQLAIEDRQLRCRGKIKINN